MLTRKCENCGFFENESCIKGNNVACLTTSPLCWVGGKYLLARKLIPLFPKHTTYVEVFGGAAHVLFQKTPSTIEIYNDIDDRLVNFFEVVQDERKNKALADKLGKALYARAVFDRCKLYRDGTDIDKAFQFAILNKMSFAADMATWGVDVACVAKQTPAFNRMPEKINKAFARMKHVQIENKEFGYVLNRYDREETFFYLDPPYAFSGARSNSKMYKHEMTDADHEKLVDCLLKLKGKAMLSGYETPLYDRLLGNGWRKISVGDSNISIQMKKDEPRLKKTEFVWVNY